MIETVKVVLSHVLNKKEKKKEKERKRKWDMLKARRTSYVCKLILLYYVDSF